MSGFLPDKAIIPDHREGMLDNLKTFCEVFMNILRASSIPAAREEASLCSIRLFAGYPPAPFSLLTPRGPPCWARVETPFFGEGQLIWAEPTCAPGSWSGCGGRRRNSCTA